MDSRRVLDLESTCGTCTPLPIRGPKVSQSEISVVTLVTSWVLKKHRQAKSQWIAATMKDQIPRHPGTMIAEIRTDIFRDFNVDIS